MHTKDKILALSHGLYIFEQVKIVAQKGLLHKKIADCLVPICVACKYGKLPRNPWQIKGEQSTLKTVTQPGLLVSEDQLESTTMGFITQLNGILTTKYYQYATIFVDHYLNYPIYIYRRHCLAMNQSKLNAPMKTMESNTKCLSNTTTWTMDILQTTFDKG